MATSVKRIIIMLLLLDIIIGSVYIFISSTNFNDSINYEYNSKLSSLDNATYDFDTNFPNGNPDTSQYKVDSQWGNIELAQKSWFEILTGGISDVFSQNQDECANTDCNSTVQKIIIRGLTFFMITIHLLGGLEIFYIIYSKKYD